MIRIVTALGNPSLNTELKKYSEFEVIGKEPGHVIGSTACLGGTLATQILNAKTDSSLVPKIYNWIRRMNDLFGYGNFFFEMQPSHNKDQIYVNQRLFELSEELASTDLKIFNVNNSETMVNDVIKILSRYNNHFSSCKIINVDKKYKRGLMYEIKQ